MEKKIKIMNIAEAAGGVDRYLKNIFKYTNRDKIENILVCSENFNTDDYKGLVSKAIQIHMEHAISAKKDFTSVKNIRALILQYKPDIVYAHSSKAGALARMADIGINNIVVYNPHGWSFNMRTSARKQRVYELIERLQIPFTDKVICISEAERDSAIKHHICRKDKLKVIYNGIDFEEYKNSRSISRAELNIPSSAFLIGFVGRITEQKSPDIFIKGAKKVLEAIPNAYFIMVGDGQQRNEIENLAAEDNIKDHLYITGWVDDPISYMKLFDVGVLLSRWEGFGLVLAEYMLAGVPIIANNVDAIPWIINNNVNGILIPVDSPNDFYAAVKRLYEDKKLASTFVSNGKEIVREKFDAKRTAIEHEGLFVSLIGRRR